MSVIPPHPFPDLEWNTDITEYAAIDFLSNTHLILKITIPPLSPQLTDLLYI